MSATALVAVAAGGLVGAPARYLVDRAITRRGSLAAPWGTITINIVGSFVLGFLTGLVLNHHAGPVANALIGTGFCGAFTTFSTFTFETLQLVEDGRYTAAATNVGVSLVLGLLAAAAGLALGLLP